MERERLILASPGVAHERLAAVGGDARRRGGARGGGRVEPALERFAVAPIGLSSARFPSSLELEPLEVVDRAAGGAALEEILERDARRRDQPHCGGCTAGRPS